MTLNCTGCGACRNICVSLNYAPLPLSTVTSKRRKSAVRLKPEKRMHAWGERGMEAGGKAGERWAGWFVRGTSAKSGVTTLRRISAPQTPNLSDPDCLPHSVTLSPPLASISPRQSVGSSAYRCYCVEESHNSFFFFFVDFSRGVTFSVVADRKSLISFTYRAPLDTI